MTYHFDVRGNRPGDLMDIPNETHILEALNQFEKDTIFLNECRDEWMNGIYADCWVIVYKEALVGHGSTLPEALQMASLKDGPISYMAREYLDTEPMTMILGNTRCPQ